MHLEKEIKNGVLTFRLEGNPLGEMHARALYQNVQKHTGEDVKHVVLNLSHVKYINSAGIGGLIRTLGVLQTKGVDLKLTSVNQNVKKVLQQTHLLGYFTDNPGSGQA